MPSDFGNEWETLISKVQGFFAFLCKNLAPEQPKNIEIWLCCGIFRLFSRHYINIKNISGIVTIAGMCDTSAIEAPGVVSPP